MHYYISFVGGPYCEECVPKDMKIHTCPPDFRFCVCGEKIKRDIITKKPILPSEEELEYNSRSKSAKLRIFEHC